MAYATRTEVTVSETVTPAIASGYSGRDVPLLPHYS